jgi:hypothetical protein
MRSYIADPYWPEQAQVIDLRKRSGVDRVKSEEKRAKVLNDFLTKMGLNQDDYDALVKKATRAWCRVDDNDPESPIVIPARQIMGMIANAAPQAPAGCRVQIENVRSLIHVTDFVTDRKVRDGVFTRFIPPKKDGKSISNQRRLEQDEFIKDFTAVGTIETDTSLKESAIKGLLVYAFNSVGVGAARKMDFGRGALSSLERLNGK